MFRHVKICLSSWFIYGKQLNRYIAAHRYILTVVLPVVRPLSFVRHLLIFACPVPLLSHKCRQFQLFCWRHPRICFTSDIKFPSGLMVIRRLSKSNRFLQSYSGVRRGLRCSFKQWHKLLTNGDFRSNLKREYEIMNAKKRETLY